MSDTQGPPAPSQPFPKLALAALGVVFGDIGTSPLYAIRECFHGDYAVSPDPENLLGVLSLMFWALMLIVTVKYLTFIFRADNHGEGGVIALTSLIRKADLSSRKTKVVLITISLFAASMLYGDGMITPAISVLSAVEGLKSAAPGLTHLVIPITLVILVGLFVIQHHGTERVGILFGPIILVWFTVLAILGGTQVVQHPQILAALLPWHGLSFLFHNGLEGFLVLGSVFLVVTGAEALYADMGHFGKWPIRVVWGCLVLPALLLNYFGQGAFLLAHPDETEHVFYALVPDWAQIPMVLLATLATIIASQAVITGAFSLTRQAIQLGYLPRLRVIHTSAQQIGQIYVPPVNWVLMLCTLSLVIGFQGSSSLAAAYGVAVTGTMTITSILFFVVARHLWGWRWWAAGLPTALFLVVDLTFFSANISKIFHGAWFPLVIAAIVFSLMIIWRQGRQVLRQQIEAHVITWDEFRDKLTSHPSHRFKGQAVFLTANAENVPPALLHNWEHNGVLHSEIALLHFETSSELPYMAHRNRVDISDLGDGVTRIVAHYGYMEEPSVKDALNMAEKKGYHFERTTASFFLGRERLTHDAQTPFGPVRSLIYSFLALFAVDAAKYYEIPLSQVIEVGISLKL